MNLGLDLSDLGIAPVADAPEQPPAQPVDEGRSLVSGSTLAKALYSVWNGAPITIVNSPPGAGKPVHVDEPILMGDGTLKRLGDVEVGDMVITHTGSSRRVSHVFEQGVIPTVTITTGAGRIIKAAPDHPFLTPQGYVNAGDLTEGQSLAALPEPKTLELATSGRADWEFRLAGYFIGDGSVSSGNCSIISADESVSLDVEAIAAKMGFSTQRAYDKRKMATHAIRFSNPEGPKKSGGPRHWLREIGVLGATAHTKTVPSFVYQGSPEQIAQFLSGYFSTDGYVQAPYEAGRTKPVDDGVKLTL